MWSNRYTSTFYKFLVIGFWVANWNDCTLAMPLITKNILRPFSRIMLPAYSKSTAGLGFGIHQQEGSRLFGTKRGVPGNPLGTISIYNDQKSLEGINEDALHETVQKISKILGYETYDVTLLLVDDEEMQETNLESRGIDAPTDILSFPFLEAERPGLLKEPEFDVPDYYTLGDMMVDVPYVIRRCREDLEDGDAVDESERGVSGAMASVSDPETRIHMLLIHGMLHLVGHDHEDDDEYEEMVTKEEEILKELNYC